MAASGSGSMIGGLRPRGWRQLSLLTLAEIALLPLRRLARPCRAALLRWTPP
ncbi:MAG: hypothetical protein ACKOPS_09635 [Cyanobium sp.]